MENKKVKKIIIVLVIVILALVLTWFLIIHPLLDFSSKEKELENAARDYYERNSVLLPGEGEMSKVGMKKLLDQKYLNVLKTTYGSKDCNEDNSWVKVKRKDGEYKYYTYLECGSMKSSIDHEGPTIKLNGDEEIQVEKNSVYNDKGVNSVYDDTDGKMDIKDVKIEGNVDTSKIGTYTIEYSAIDSFENKNVVTRKVTVVQTLDKLVKKETDKSNIYTSDEDNYIMFSNMLFRIVGLNNDGSVKIVSDESVGAVNYKDINDWLNDYFYDHIMDDYKDYMVKQEFCTSTIAMDKIDTITNKCDSKDNRYVGLLSVSEYNKTKYLYPSSISWTSDSLDSKSAISVSNNLAGTDSKYMVISNKYNFGIHPVVNIKKGTLIISGDGSKGNPYRIIKKEKVKVGEKISYANTGEYVKYAGYTYRIIEPNKDENTKVISMFALEEYIRYDSSITSPVYNPTQKGNIGYYIENNVSKNVKTDIFVKKQITVDIYNKDASYSGDKTEKKYNVKFAAPDMYELFSGSMGNENNGYWLRTSSKKSTIKYIVSPIDVIFYGSMPDNSEAGIRFTGYLNKNVTVLSGDGTVNNPYELTK